MQIVEADDLHERVAELQAQVGYTESIRAVEAEMAAHKATNGWPGGELVVREPEAPQAFIDAKKERDDGWPDLDADLPTAEDVRGILATGATDIVEQCEDCGRENGHNIICVQNDVERMRAALTEIAEDHYGVNATNVEIARAALNEKKGRPMVTPGGKGCLGRLGSKAHGE